MQRKQGISRIYCDIWYIEILTVDHGKSIHNEQIHTGNAVNICVTKQHCRVCGATDISQLQMPITATVDLDLMFWIRHLEIIQNVIQNANQMKTNEKRFLNWAKSLFISTVEVTGKTVHWLTTGQSENTFA